jgi:hypothetical protein
MIQALPTAVRREYEALRAETIVLYPRKLVADDGVLYDQLTQELAVEGLPWVEELDLEKLKLRRIERLDDAYVSLRFHLGALATRMGELRLQAQQREGKGSGADLGYKLMANTVYGVLACPHYATNNFVAANQITAMARAAAFAMVMSLNGLQVITDGCTYRRDRVPSCSFEECLRRQADYPLRHADERSGIPFQDPRTIPDDDDGFGRWYIQHVQRFFRSREFDFRNLLSIRRLAHKEAAAGTCSFDALGTAGCGDYVKAIRNDAAEYDVLEVAARGYRKPMDPKLVGWLSVAV